MRLTRRTIRVATLSLVFASASFASVTAENTANVQLVVGSPRDGRFQDGNGLSARLNAPAGLAVDGNGNVVIADFGNHRIRRMTTGGELTTVAGSGEGNFEDADSGSKVTFNAPAGVDVGPDGDMYVADSQNDSIRRVRSDGGGTVTLAPRGGVSKPRDVAVDPKGGIYVAEAGGGWVRKLNGSNRPDVVLKGLSEPQGIAVGPDGSLYVSDYGHQRIKRIYPRSRSWYTFAGTGNYGVRDGLPGYATFGRPAAVTVDKDGYVYVADLGTHRIRIISPLGVVATLAGGNEGFNDGAAKDAQFDGPRGIAVSADASTVYVADWHNNAIRRITGFDRARLTAPPTMATTRDRALARGIPVTCFGNDRGRCAVSVSYNGRVFAQRRIKLDYIGHRTVYVKIPVDARESVRSNPRTDFLVTGTFSGRVGVQKLPEQTVAAR